MGKVVLTSFIFSLLKEDVTAVRDGLMMAFQHGTWRDVADAGVEAFFIVVVDEFRKLFDRILIAENDGFADGVGFDRFLGSLEFAVGLRVVGACSDVLHALDAKEGLEILGNELGSIV